LEYYWLCKCGDQVPNTKDGQGLQTIRRHVMEKMRARERGHVIKGLYDEDGNCLVPGDNPKLAIELGLMDRAPDSAWSKRGKGKQGQTIIDEPQGSKSPTNLQGVLTAMRIALPPSTWGWLSLGFKYFRKEDGTPFGWTPEDVGLYIAEVISYWHQQHLPQIFGLTPQQASLPEIRAQLQAIIEGIKQMDVGPSLPVDVVKGGLS